MYQLFISERICTFYCQVFDCHRGKVCYKRLTTSHQMNCLENLQWSELSDDYVPIKLVHFPSVIGLNNKSLLQFNFEKYKSILLSVFSLFLEFIDFFFTFKHKTKWGLECINVFNRLSSLVWKSEERVPLVPFLLQT